MARFKNKDIRLSANEEVLFGDAQEASIKYDGSDLVTDHVLKHSAQGYFATREFVNDVLTGLEWQDSVLSITTDIPAGVYGERYIIPTGATGAWSGRDDDIAEYTTTWVYTTPSAGMSAWVEDEGAYFVYSTGSWARMGSVVDHSLLDNLDVDDHTQYLLADGSRGLVGTLQATTVSAGTFEGPGYTHAGLVDVHNLTTDINHNTILNNHNLTTSIDHDTITNNHNLTTDIDHNALTNYAANRHIDWTNASDNLLTSGNVSAAAFYGDGSTMTGVDVSGTNIYLGDTNKIYFGDEHETEIYFDGTNAMWDNTTGDVRIRFGSDIAIKATIDSSVTLYHNGSSRLVTTAAGVSFTGDLLPSDDIYLTDTGTLYLGSNPDSSVYHNGSHAYWDNLTGNTYIRGNGTQSMIDVIAAGAVNLYNAGNLKFATTTAGIDITGAINVDSLPATDESASGTTTTMNVTGNTVGFGSALYMTSGGGGLDEADADWFSTMPCRALALETGTGQDKSVLLKGFIRDDSWSWTQGLPVYVSTTVGTLTQTRPTGSGDQVQIVGWAHRSNVLYFDPDSTVVEIA